MEWAFIHCKGCWVFALEMVCKNVQSHSRRAINITQLNGFPLNRLVWDICTYSTIGVLTEQLTTTVLIQCVPVFT